MSASFIGGCIVALLSLVPLFGFLALSEELEDVGKGAYGTVDAILVVAYSLPAMTVELLPVTVLLGGLLGLGVLANNLELVAMRATAMSPMRMAVPVIKLSLVLVAIVLLLQTLVIPQVEYSASRLRAKTLMQPSLAGLGDDSGTGADSEFWTRSRGQFIRIGRIRPDRSLTALEIYQFDTQGNLAKMLQASAAELLEDNTWLLHTVRETQLDDTHSQTELKDAVLWETLLTEEQTHTLITPVSSLSPLDLWKFIQRLEANNMNSKPTRIIFWNQMSTLLGLLGMALLTIPFLVGSVRSISVGQRIAMGGLIGISYYLAQQISGHLAGILHWNPALIVMCPGLVVSGVALALLGRAN